ncbi:MAG: hypothetical protein RQ743_11720 [Bacteroidales bacterium]|nr:hypothetical protein [Bacteroidales bacterium]
MKFDVQVYTTDQSPRLEYAVDLVLGNILGLSYIITDSPLEGLPLINYSYDRAVGGLFIQPEGLLFEKGIRPQEIWVAHFNGIPLFFQQPPEAGFQLDIFSFAFYMASRYEEYLPLSSDEHGRFAVESSLAYKHDFLDLPVVDIWSHRLGVTLKLLYPGLLIPAKKYNCLLTIDVDEPFAYKGRGLWHNLSGLLGDMLKGKNPGKRLSCMTGRMKDEYDTYSYINATAEKYDCEVLYFFSAGAGKGINNNSIRPGRKCYRKLLRRLVSRYVVGLRTSYGPVNFSKLIAREKMMLENAAGKKVTKVRKHHLFLTIADTYRLIESLGIYEDYTMGHVREPGFRAGLARPFKFYDLLREETSRVTIVPYQFVELTYMKYKRYDQKETLKSISNLINRTKEVGGIFVSIWHNTSLADEGEWERWRKVFEYTLKEQAAIR